MTFNLKIESSRFSENFSFPKYVTFLFLWIIKVVLYLIHFSFLNTRIDSEIFINIDSHASIHFKRNYKL